MNTKVIISLIVLSLLSINIVSADENKTDFKNVKNYINSIENDTANGFI